MRRPGKPPKARLQLSEYITDSYAYIDSEQVWFEGAVPRHTLRELKANCGYLRYEKKRMSERKDNRWVRYMLAHQPKDRFHEILDGLEIGMLINRIELANDLISSDPPALKGLVDMHFHQPRRGRRPLGYCGSTSYSKNKRWGGHNVAVYEAPYSKETGEVDCVRVEWRLSGAQCVRRAGIHRPIDLKTFDHDAFWAERFDMRTLDLDELGRCMRRWHAKCRMRALCDDGLDRQRALLFIRAAQQPGEGNKQPVRPTGSVEMLKAEATARSDAEFNRQWNSRAMARQRKAMTKIEIKKLRRRIRDRTRLNINPALQSTQ